MLKLLIGRAIFCIVPLIVMPVAVSAYDRETVDTSSQDAQLIAPNADLLEFLVEFGDTNPDTFELILYHGVRDSEVQEAEGKKEAGRE